MFFGCSKLKLSTSQTVNYTTSYRIPKSGTGTYANSALGGMFDNTGGTFTGTPSINTTYYLDVSDNYYLTFKSPETFTLKVYDNTKHWNGTLEYKVTDGNWTTWDGTEISSGSDGILMMRGTGNTVITGSS